MHTRALYIHTMAARIPLSSMTKVTHPAILPISPRTFGNNVPKSLHKTRRSWWPNVTRANLTVTILDGQPMGPTLKGKEKEVLGAIPRTQALKGVKIAVRDLKDVDKAGGVEGLLVSSFKVCRRVELTSSCRDRRRTLHLLDKSCERSCSDVYIWKENRGYLTRHLARGERRRRNRSRDHIEHCMMYVSTDNTIHSTLQSKIVFI